MKKPDYLTLLIPFTRYVNNAWRDLGDGRGFFGDGSHVEAGIRTQANVVFTSALLQSLPAQTTGLDTASLAKLRQCNHATLRYLTSAHLTGNKACQDGQQWGGVWQSAWWTTRLALGARLIWSSLDAEEQAAVQRVVCYEANLQLQRLVPTGLAEDTKAEENAWDAEILATAVAMFPNHPQRDAWWLKFREFAINTFSTATDRQSKILVDGVPLADQVYTVNLHSDHTLENHGAYHFCYVASPLHSITWSYYALMTADIVAPEALFHNIQSVWERAKTTFLDSRFAYVSGKDWARYTYGLYFIVPVLQLLQYRYQDADAVAIEWARVADLAAEQSESTDGSFFGARFTQGHYFGQYAKYETDCYANLGLAYLLQQKWQSDIQPTSLPKLQQHLSGCHVSPECGIAFARSSLFFASFSWKTLTSTQPIALFVPIGHDSMAEWQAHNLLGHVVLLESAQAIGIRAMRQLDTGFEVEGTLSYQNRKGQFLYEHRLRIVVETDTARMHVQSRFIASRKIFVRRVEGLRLALANDRFNHFQREVHGSQGRQILNFDPKQRLPLQNKTAFWARVLRRLLREANYGQKRHQVGGNWLNIDNALGVISRKQRDFTIIQRPGRNVADGSLHYDAVYCPYQSENRWFQPGDVMLDSEFTLMIGDIQATADYAKEMP